MGEAGAAGPRPTLDQASTLGPRPHPGPRLPSPPGGAGEHLLAGTALSLRVGLAGLRLRGAAALGAAPCVT